MPKAKGMKGRRSSRKKAVTIPVDEESTELETGLNSSHENISEVELEEAEQDMHECTSVEHTDNDISSLKTEAAKQNLECISDLKNDSNEEAKLGDAVNKQTENNEVGAGKCQDAINKTNHVVEKLDKDNIHEVKGSRDNQGTELLKIQQMETVHESSTIEDVGTKLYIVGAAGMEIAQKTNDVQCIADKDNMDIHLADVDNNRMTGSANNELTKQNIMEETVGSITVDKKDTADLIQSSIIELKQDEGIESKFEEISEGSIEQPEQDDLNTESISDAEIIGETYEPRTDANSKNDPDVEGKPKVLHQDSETTAKNKDNDEISNASLSDHVDAVSLEEISDDDLEPSRKRRKSSGQSPIRADNTVKEDKSSNPYVENIGKQDEMIVKVTIDNPNAKVQKHAASEDNDESQPSSVKRMKLSHEKEVPPIDDKQPQLSTGICNDLKNQDDRSQRSITTSDRNLMQSSKNWRQESSEKSSSSRDKVLLNRKYDLVDASCQSEPRLLKGKIVQCNINPIKSTSELDKQEIGAESDPLVIEMLVNLINKLPSNIPDKVLSDVISLQSSGKKGIYSLSVGPLILSDIQSSTFQEVLSGTESFSLAFDNHSQGFFKATFSKLHYTVSLFTWLSHREWNNHCIIVSLIYSCDIEESACSWKAILLLTKEKNVQTESQLVNDSEKSTVKLYLNGVPKGVSTTFINLLFPEAQNVVIGPGTSKTTITLDFYNSKLVEKIISSYDMLVINGSQVTMSQINSQDDQRNMNLPTEASKKSDILIQKGKEHKEQDAECDKICENLEQGTSDDFQKKNFEAAKKHENDQQQNEVSQNEISSDLRKDDASIATITQDMQHKNVESDTSVVTGTVSSLSAEEITSKQDQSVDSSQLKDTENEIAVELIGVSELKKPDDHSEGKKQENILGSAIDVTDKRKEVGEDELSNILQAANKLEAIGQKKTQSKTDEVSSEEKPHNKNKESVSVTTFVAIEVSDKENAHDLLVRDENLNGDSLKKVAANEDLKEAETNLTEKSEVLVNISCKENNIKDSSERKDENCDIKLRARDGTESENGPRGGESKDSKLVMTDGDLEVSMEVIDVNSGDSEQEKVIYPRNWHRFQDKPAETSSYFAITRKVNMGAYSSGIHHSHHRNPHIESNMPRTSRHHPWSSWKETAVPQRTYIELTAQKKDTFPTKHRSRSPSPGRDTDRHSYNYASDHHRPSEQWSKIYESQQSGTYGDSKRVETYSKPAAESRSGAEDLQSGNTDQHTTVKPSGHSSHRDLHYSAQRQDNKRFRSPSLSRLSEASDSQAPALRRSPHRRNSKHSVRHTSRSPISTSSRSRSLSPISKSPSPDLSNTGSDKDELVKTVHHFLKLAKGLQETKKRHRSRTKSSRLSSSRHSPPRMSRSPYAKRSRSPQSGRSRSSKSPTYVRSSRYKYDRSPSPISHRDDHKKHYGDHSSDKRSDHYSKESGGSRSYERERSQRSGDYPFEELIGRSKSGKWLEPKYSEQFRSLNEQPWQQSHGTYQPQSSGPVSASNLYNPSCPPPGCPPQEVKAGIFPGSSMPVYQYSNQSPYNYPKIPTNIPPPFIPPIPPSTAFPPPPFRPMFPPRF